MEIYILILFLITVQLLLLISFRNLKSSVRKTQCRALAIARKNETLLHSMNLLIENLTKSSSLPFPLCNIPNGDASKIVVSVKKVLIPLISMPYNASIGKFGNEYLLFFRYDEPKFKNERPKIFSNIGLISLNQNFEPLEKVSSKIETNSHFSEDARFFQNGNKYYLVYNDLNSLEVERRGMRIGEIDLSTRKLKYITSLDVSAKRTEKNWTPFSYQDEIHFLYTINPTKTLILPDPKKNLVKSPYDLLQSELGWSTKWGALRGGTPAQLIDGQYLAFFHSSFEDYKGVIWYLMGAYTFSAKPPFNLTAISPYPILFKEIYETPHQLLANPKIRAIYPTGYVYENREGKELIHVSCGENDSAIKIISMDKTKLLESLRPLHCVDRV